jgi:hypothetical protein
MIMGEMAEYYRDYLYPEDDDWEPSYYGKSNRNKKKKELSMKNMNKFYVGATHIANSIKYGTNGQWTHKTLAEATEHAKKLMEEQDTDLTIIVKIVRIVKRSKPPITIEDVK